MWCWVMKRLSIRMENMSTSLYLKSMSLIGWESKTLCSWKKCSILLIFRGQVPSIQLKSDNSYNMEICSLLLKSYCMIWSVDLIMLKMVISISKTSCRSSQLIVHTIGRTRERSWRYSSNMLMERNTLH